MRPNPSLVIVNKPALDIPVSGEPFVLADANAPQINVMDLGIIRGDGMFETAAVVDGNIQALNWHLDRFVNSAKILDMPKPDVEVWAAAIKAGVADFAPGHEAYAKFIMTRGIAGSDTPTGWVYVADAEDFAAVRTAGIKVVTLSRGYPHTVAKDYPWLLQGAKTLSYAVHKSVLREAERRGAEDVIFTSTDGFVLEGPTSSVLLKLGDTLVTPATDQGILNGTTQRAAFKFAQANGLQSVERPVEVSELANVDAAWLVSSVRQAAVINTLDGKNVPVDTELSAKLNEFLLARTE